MPGSAGQTGGAAAQYHADGASARGDLAGWERFTDAVIRGVNEKDSPVLIALWGVAARRKAELLTPARHPSAQAANPSSLSARNGFFGSRPFSVMNAALRAVGAPEIAWQNPDG